MLNVKLTHEGIFFERICFALFTDMTSTISTYVDKRKKQALYKGFVPLVEVATSPTKKRVAAVSSAGDSYVSAKIPEARLVGQQDWVILFEDESESETEKRLKLLEETADRLEVLEQKVMDLEAERDSLVLICISAMWLEKPCSLHSASKQKLEAYLQGLRSWRGRTIPSSPGL